MPVRARRRAGHLAGDLYLLLLAARHRFDEDVLYSYQEDQQVSQIGDRCVRREGAALSTGIAVGDELPCVTNSRALLYHYLLIIDIREVVQAREQLHESLQVDTLNLWLELCALTPLLVPLSLRPSSPATRKYIKLTLS